MDEEVYNELEKTCNRLEDIATSRFLDIDIFEIYSDRLYDDKLIYGLLLQLKTIAEIKNKIERLRNFRMITKGLEGVEPE